MMGFRRCGGLPTRLPAFLPTPNSAVGNRAPDGIRPHKLSLYDYFAKGIAR